jgi:hypothetical protein
MSLQWWALGRALRRKSSHSLGEAMKRAPEESMRLWPEQWVEELGGEGRGGGGQGQESSEGSASRREHEGGAAQAGESMRVQCKQESMIRGGEEGPTHVSRKPPWLMATLSAMQASVVALPSGLSSRLLSSSPPSVLASSTEPHCG